MPRYEYPEIAEKITYKKTPMYKGEMFSANLEKNRITIEVEGEMKVKAGKLVVLSNDEYSTLQADLEKAKELIKYLKAKYYDSIEDSDLPIVNDFINS